MRPEAEAPAFWATHRSKSAAGVPGLGLALATFARPDPVAPPEPSIAADLTTAPKRVRYWCERVLFPEAAEPTPGWIEVEGERIVSVGTGASPEPAQVLDGLLAPGFVDVHCHGGGGASFVTADVEVARQALRAHRRHGVTSLVASLVTGHTADLKRQVGCLAPLVAGGELAGVHLEGPWLAPAYHGAHPAELLADPLPEAVADLLDAGDGAIRMVTIAPERAGAFDAIGMLIERGVVTAVGHTDADYDTCKLAINAGATGATHLFNAMAPLRHREPGPALALWEDPRVYLELIADGVHVRPELIAFVAATAPARVVLISDAMAAAGFGDGVYMLGELPVRVRDGVARVTGTDTIAGSTLTLDQAVRNCVAVGIPLAQSVRAATATPADYLGLSDVGRLAPGMRADLVVLDDELVVRAVMFRGEWIELSEG